MLQDPHLLQILLEHLEHGLQFSHLSLKSYVTLAVKENTQNLCNCSPSSLIETAFHIRRYSCIYRGLPGCGPWQRNGLQLYVGLLGTGGTTAPVVGLSKDKTSLDCGKRKEMEKRLTNWDWSSFKLYIMLWLSLRMKLHHIEANVGIYVPRYHNVCFFQSQRNWPHPPGGSIPGDCPCPKMGGASALGGGVHDGAQPSPPMTCQMPKGHLMENKDATI